MDNYLVTKGNFRKKMITKFFLYGLICKSDAFASLENEFLNGFPPYNSLDEFMRLILDILINKLPTDNSLIDKDFAELILKRLYSLRKEEPIISHDLVIRNVNCNETSSGTKDAHLLHAKFLRSLCKKFVDYLESTNNSFEIKQLSTVINTYRATLNCNVFGFLRRDLSKINEYIFEDETGSCIVEFNENTERRNCVILENSFVLIDGTFHSLANALICNKIGYLPSKLTLDLNEEDNQANESEKSVQNVQSNMFIIIKDAFLDERPVLEKLKILFTAYNAVDPLPHFFVFIGPFTRDPVEPKRLKELFQFFFRIILTCPNIAQKSKILIVPAVEEQNKDTNFIKSPLFDNNEFQLNNLDVNFTSNPVNLYVNDRHICIFSSNYFKLVTKHILFRKKVSDEDFYNEFCNIMLSNSYLLPGLSKNFSNSFNLFHYPDLLIFADDSIKTKEISFKLTNRVWIINLQSFSNDKYKFKVYYSDTRVIEDSEMNL